ncbi:phosphatidylinositol 4-kinase [Comamonas endophytica]|uniref:Phosphatidylinositol 4-kinase n=1 Tax=Comamonas endophytica TaxID=2949090 RepID=A0ABY6GEI2_9BURK|nr:MULTISPECIES: phosphatidylinositol 4-kinase [unclassified Acidovorax]MCD2513145.1 phosphatidylinositol 4-kinase [Acidovorax sp. D4N7]UYG53504.1 phosphatidylinositol 4-kinase [Acidovorax sp. 5MLIR]
MTAIDMRPSGGSALASSLIAHTTKGSESSEEGSSENSGTMVMNSGTVVARSVEGSSVASFAPGTAIMGSALGTAMQGSGAPRAQFDFMQAINFTEFRSVPAPTLEQREAWPADPSPVLVRQARYGALPSAAALPSPNKLTTPEATFREVIRGLPTVDQFTRVVPLKTPTFLESVKRLFGLDKAATEYGKVLTALGRYHDSCNQTTGGNGVATKFWLDELAKTVDDYGKSGAQGSLDGKMINELRQQIDGESNTLKSLQAQLKDGPGLPKGANFSHALAFIRDGISLQDMVRLIDKGLELDQIPEAQALLESEERSIPQRNYINILVELDHYQDAFAAHTLQESERTPTAQTIEDAAKLLEKLQTTTEKYLQVGTSGDPHTQAIKDLRDQLSLEHRVLSDLVSELKMGTALPEGADLSRAVAFAREGISLKDMDRFMASGMSPAEARKQLDTEKSDRVRSQLSNLAPEQKQALLDSFSTDEIVLLETSGLGIEGGHAYRVLDLPITSQTIVHADEQEVGSMLPLGAGACNEVYSARYSTPAGIVQGVFKPLRNKESAGLTMKLGIDSQLAKIGNRNLCTQDVARALDFDVVGHCQIGYRQEPGKPLELGLIMARAAGKPAADTPLEVFHLPQVRRNITQLNLLDAVCGQGDRHYNNYFIDESTGKVTGIDNDLCFGQATMDGNHIAQGANAKRDTGFRGTKMPELIDTNMAKAIRSLTPERLAAILGDKLSSAEMEAAKKRLLSVQKHVDGLQERGQIVTPEEFDARDEIGKLQNADNSYVGRDAENASWLLKVRERSSLLPTSEMSVET